MKNIITIQHAQSIHHTNGMVGSWTDWDLSDLGVQQAKNIGAKLSQQLNNRYIMYSSDLIRARHTAEIVGEYMGITPIVAGELRERYLGKCIGKSVQWLRENMENQERTVDDRIFSDAESRRDVWNRIKPFFEKIISSQDENIIIVSHGDLLGIFNVLWLGLPVETLNKCDSFGLAGGVSFLQESMDGRRIIKRLSDMSYIIE
jgi:broad specificity phosphatase PhoE